MMLKPTVTICVFSVVCTFLYSTLVSALVGIRPEGNWPESWPKELEPYRKQAQTFEVAHGTQETVYEIRFKDRKEFEGIWPTILRVKSKGAPLTLLRLSPKQEGRLFDDEKPLVRIYCPPYGSNRIRSLGTLSGIEPPWPESVRSSTGQLPEYAEQTVGGVWVPEQKGKQTRVKYRARIDIHLVVDGEIIDLDRIYLPADTPIVNESNLTYEGMETTDSESLVDQIETTTLTPAADETFRRHTQAGKGPEDIIQPRFWAEEIRRLRPIRVYVHRTNIVIILREIDDVEEGLYIYIPISSYFPQNGDDGFIFEYLGDGVYKYRRTLLSDSPNSGSFAQASPKLESEESERSEEVITNGYPVKGGGDSTWEVIPHHLNQNLVLYYSFHADANRKTVTDISGNSHYGQVHGAEYAEDKVLGGMMSFDGDEDYISIPDVYLREFTFSAWVKTTTDNLNNRRIFLLSDGEHCYALQGNTKAGVGVYVSDGVELNEYDWRLAEGIWTHISVVHDGYRLGIYRNGRLTEAGDIGGSGVAGTLYIGGTDMHRGGFWHGVIDEVALFSRALTTEEIEQLYSMTGTAVEAR